ncbi:MAG: PulJ/GspJ family protein [Blastocatellia bacterium]
MNPDTQRGFTLIEALVTAILTAIIVAGAMAALIAFQHHAQALVESREINEQASIVINLLQTDIDQAARNLGVTANLSAGPEAALFQPDAYYTSAAGTLTKTGPTGWNHTDSITRTFQTGTASVGFQPPASGGEVALYSNNPAIQDMIMIPNGTGSVSVLENGVVATTLGSFQTGDSYRVSQETNSSGTVVVDYYRTRSSVESLVYTSAKPALAYPLGAYLALYSQGSSAANVQLQGGVLADAQTGSSLPPLPFDTSTGQRLAEPVTITQQSGSFTQAVLLTGDSTIDPVYTVASYTPSTSPLSIQVTTPRRGTFAIGDYVLLVDPRPAAKTSSLFRVDAAANSGSGISVTVESMAGASPASTAWGRLYSAAPDFAHSYPVGSLLVRLAPLLTYRLATGGILQRAQTYRQGTTEGENAATLALGVSAFSILPVVSGTTRAYNLTVVLTTEGFETASRSDQLNFTVTPRSLTLPAEWMSQMP